MVERYYVVGKIEESWHDLSRMGVDPEDAEVELVVSTVDCKDRDAFFLSELGILVKHGVPSDNVYFSQIENHRLEWDIAAGIEGHLPGELYYEWSIGRERVERHVRNSA